MAVQAQYVAHAFPHDPRAIRPEAYNVTSASLFLGEPGGCHLLADAAQQQQPAAVGSCTVLSELTGTKNNDGCCFVQRKRTRVGDVVGAGSIMEGQRTLLPPVPVPLAFAPGGDVQSRVLCSDAASTSGRPSTSAPVSHGLLSQLYRQGVEIDAFIRIESERLRAGLQEARRRHVRAVVSAVETAAARRLRDAEVELERALARNAELDEKLRQMGAEGQAWQGVARSHEAVAAGLRATLDQLLQSPCAGPEGEGHAEDAHSCCFGQAGATTDGGEAPSVGRVCKACGEADACVLLLPCRHLCLCAGCEVTVGECPVCAATKNASLHVLLS